MTHLRDLFESLAIEAGAAIIELFNAGLSVSYKADLSPVTAADERAEGIILKGLAAAFPSIPVVSEEAAAMGCVPELGNRSFFLVDPLDGTKEFISRRSDFTVNIALIESNLPIAGIVYAPAQQCAYVTDGTKAEKLILNEKFKIEQRICIRARSRGASLTAVTSRSHDDPETQTFLLRNGIRKCTAVGSSLKFCQLAEGKADVYPRFGRTMQWDTAAGDAILRASGGSVVKLDGSRLLYGETKEANDIAFSNPHFVAWGIHRS